MARPKHDNPELFTNGEIAHGAEVSVRNLQFLKDSGLSPEAEEAKGAALHDSAALMHFAMVAGLHKAGLPLIYAARICMPLRHEFNDFALGYMSGLARQSFARNYPSFPDGDFYFWFHDWLRREGADSYVPGQAWDNDIVLLVADRRYVLKDVHKPRLTGQMVFGDGHFIEAGPDPFCEIDDASTPGTLTVTSLYEREEWGFRQCQLDLLAEYRDALDNAVGVSRANLSLAIRNCLDRVHDLRMSKGGKLFPK